MDVHEIDYIETKSILSRLRSKDNFFGVAYNMNLYRGCQHGCIYCDTRSSCYGIGDISRISVKRNALELLEAELAIKRGKATVGTGSMNDPYMPLEKQLGLTRGALELLAKYHFPVHVITKGNLITRDADLLKDISRTYAAVSFTITTADDELARKLEPLAPPPSTRFEAMKELADRGIYTGVTMMPVLPFINDSIEDVEEVVEKAAEAGASYILPMFGVTLRNGSRQYFYEQVANIFPKMPKRYKTYFADRYECISPNAHYLNEAFSSKIETLGLSSRMRFYDPKEKKQLSLFSNLE